jgi:hypothetical protein
MNKKKNEKNSTISCLYTLDDIHRTYHTTKENRRRNFFHLFFLYEQIIKPHIGYNLMWNVRSVYIYK